MESIPGLMPGEVDSYDAPTRTCRVRIPGVTDGSNVLPVAVFNNPLGDRADNSDAKSHTEILIKPGDLVWLMFECGDPRFPIIMGFRTKRAGNPTAWRRWKHANIEMTADGDLVFNASRVVWNVSGNVESHIGGNATSDIGGKQQTTVTGAIESTAATAKLAAASYAINANTTVAGSFSNVAGAGGAIGMTLTGGTMSISNMTVTYSNSIITSSGKRIDHAHTHTAQGATAVTTVPN